MRSLLVLTFLVFTCTLRAIPLAGAWETFPSRTNADAWTLYSYNDGIFAPPPWAGPETDANPYVYSYFAGGAGVWFFADGFTARGAFVGNYATQKISGVDVSVNVDPAEIDFIDLAVHADGPLGPGYYYSQIRGPENLGMMPDWYKLSFSFKNNWFSLRSGTYTPFQPGAAFLASIREIGVRIFPVPGVTVASFVGVDDFILVPTTEAPPLSTSISGGNFVLGFTPGPGLSATIQKLAPDFQWGNVAGQSDLTGPQAFTRPVGAGTALFRVAAREKLTQVTSP